MEILERLVPDAFGDPAARCGPRSLCSAVTITTVRAGTDSSAFDVEASADADTTATITHGIGATPEEVTLTWLKVEARLSLWAATTINSTQVVCTKQTTMGSGVAGNQLRVYCKRPHSIGK
jgi:hypothetical protein